MRRWLGNTRVRSNAGPRFPRAGQGRERAADLARGSSDPIGDALRTVLLAEWLMDGADGAAEPDAWTNGYDLTANNSPGTAAGTQGTSRTFTTAGVKYFSRTQAALNPSEGAYSLWVYNFVDTGTYGLLMGVESSVFLGRDNAGNAGWYDFGAAAFRGFAYSAVVGWQHWLFNFKSGVGAELFINGVSVVTGGFTYAGAQTSFQIGGRGTNGHDTTSRVDLTQVFSAQLTAPQIAYLAASPRVLSA